MYQLINWGYWGLFIGTFLAGTVLPLSSDILLLGVFALGGNEWVCLIVATMGNWLGTLATWGLGRLGKWEWLERWFKVKREKIEKQKEKINRYGVWLALFSWLPIIGVLIVTALGFYKVRPKLTVILLLIGCFARFLVWTLLYVVFADRFVEFIAR